MQTLKARYDCKIKEMVLEDGCRLILRGFGLGGPSTCSHFDDLLVLNYLFRERNAFARILLLQFALIQQLQIMADVFLVSCQVVREFLIGKQFTKTLKSFEYESGKCNLNFSSIQLKSQTKSELIQCFNMHLENISTILECLVSKLFTKEMELPQNTPDLQKQLFVDYLDVAQENQFMGFNEEVELSKENSILMMDQSFDKKPQIMNQNSVVSSIPHLPESDQKLEDTEMKNDQSFQSNLTQTILRKQSDQSFKKHFFNSMKAKFSQSEYSSPIKKVDIPKCNRQFHYPQDSGPQTIFKNNLSISNQNNSTVQQNNSRQRQTLKTSLIVPSPNNQQHPLRRFILKASLSQKNLTEMINKNTNYAPYVPFNINSVPNIPTAFGIIDYMDKKEGGSKQRKVVNLKNIESSQAKLKNLLQGVVGNDGWEDGVQFTDMFIKSQGQGTNGLVSCLQAYFICHYHYILRIQKKEYEPGHPQRERVMGNCFIASFAEILLSVCETKLVKKKIKVALAKKLKDINTVPIPLEQIQIFEIEGSTVEQIYSELLDLKNFFIGPRNYGLLLVLYSVLFTKGLEKLIADFDNKMLDNQLINGQRYSNQELINLLLAGQATSNCFNGNINLDDKLEMKGIRTQSKIGFLSINEYYRFVQIGSNYKDPVLPIWITCTNQRYQVLFGWNSSMKQPEDDLKWFDLGYIEEKENKLYIVKVIRFEDKTQQLIKSSQVKSLNLGQRLNLLIKTKWGQQALTEVREFMNDNE